MRRNLFLIAIATTLLIIITGLGSSASDKTKLPTPQVHPLPPSLVHWEVSSELGDYFSEVKATSLGYLIWSEFPVQVYIEQPPTSVTETAKSKRFWAWFKAVQQAVKEWNEYLPLQTISEAELADIVIRRSLPPLNPKLNPETGLYDLPRMRSAQTSYEFYLDKQEKHKKPLLSHRITIQISPNQTQEYIIAATRHELGHGLGIWGHSPVETDTMYFSQVRNSSPISPRDINTLKKIYQQPTQLGWHLH